MDPAQPDYAFIVTVGFACAVALSIAVVVLMQVRPRLSLHNLRIAFSVGCGIACVLLIVLWVRSYWWYDIRGYYSTVASLSLESNHGSVKMYSAIGPSQGGGFVGGSMYNKDNGAPKIRPWEFRHSLLQQFDLHFTAPHWFVAVLFVILAAIPWIRWRFSLRTLLIATTMIAVVLGLIVWLLR
jgi:hypothetical protein